MGTTPLLKIPYPEPSDSIATYPAQAKAMCEAIENAIVGAKRYTTGIMSAASGWSIRSQNFIVINRVIWYDIQFQRSGAALAVGTSGDMTDILVGTMNLAALGFGSLTISGPVGSINQRLIGTAWNTSGGLTLYVTAPGQDIYKDQVLQIMGTTLAA